jgi:hypothetical protein
MAETNATYYFGCLCQGAVKVGRVAKKIYFFGYSCGRNDGSIQSCVKNALKKFIRVCVREKFG